MVDSDDRCYLRSWTSGRGKSGSLEALLPPGPLRTGLDSFPSSGSSLSQRPLQDAACPISFSFAHESAGDSWRATTPSCRTCPVLRSSAISYGGRAWAALPFAALADTPDIGLLAPCLGIRSAPVPHECDSVSRSSAL